MRASEQLAQHRYRNTLWCARMASQRQAHCFARGPLPFLGNRTQDVAGYFEAPKQRGDVRLFEVGIFEQRLEDFFAVFVNQQFQLFG